MPLTQMSQPQALLSANQYSALSTSNLSPATLTSNPLAPSMEGCFSSSWGRSSLSPTPITHDPGSVLADAYNLGTLSNSMRVLDAVSGADPVDIYQVFLANANPFHLSLTGMVGDADVFLRDHHGNVIASSTDWFSNDEAIDHQALAAGTYYVQVSQYSGDTGYTLSMSTGFVNELLPTEVDLGALNGTVTQVGMIHNKNTTDTYRFTFSGGNLNLSLAGLTADADISLILDGNGNGAIDAGETIASSYQWGSSDESINLGSLVAGTYFAQIYQYSGETSYRFSLSSEAMSNLVPTEVMVGTLSGSRDFKGIVHNGNTSDTYRFNLATTSAFVLSLSDLSSDADVRLIRDGNGNGIVDAGEVVAQSFNPGNNNERISVAGLAAGDYLVQVSQYGGDTLYSLSMSASVVGADLAGNTPGTAYNIGLLDGTRNFSDFVGNADQIDFYQFTVNGESLFRLTLDGLSADADVFLAQDRNNNGLVDSGEYIDWSTAGGATAESITTQLATGTFLVGVYQYSGDTFYNLTLSADALTLPPGFNSNFGYGLVNAAAAVAAALGQNPFVDVPNLGGNDWGLDMVNAPEVWNQGYTGSGVVVAVIDTGVDYNHSDLDANIWINSGEIAGNGIDDDANGYIDDWRGWDFVDSDNDAMDLEGHGTHVAGTIAAENNGFGVTGVAYNARIMPVRVLGPNGGTGAGVAAGIRYAVDNGADVINLSLGGGFSQEMQDAIQYAAERGVVVVMAAGNAGEASPNFPAHLADRWGIAVGAVDSNTRMANFSNRAGISPLDYVVAPGAGVYSTTPGNTYSTFNGTSMATPHVAGVAALILSANPTLTPAQVENLLTGTANSSVVTV